MATITLLQAKSQFWDNLGQLYQGTATGGAATKITDTAFKNVASDTFPWPVRGKQLRVTSGSASGDLRICVDTDPTEGDLFPNADFSAAVASTNTYEVWGTSIHGGSVLTSLFNAVLRELRPITFTRLNVERFQTTYDITTMVDAPEDVVAVWERHFNYDVGGDYLPYRLRWWRPFRSAGGGTPTVLLEIPAPQVFATTQLNGSINSAVTSATVDATADAPSPGIDFPSSGRLVVESELIDYTGTTATTFTGLSRGAGNSAAATHADDTRVDQANGIYYYVEHYTSFTAFATDSSTVDAIYRDWIAWEAVLRHARTKMLAPGADRPYWKELRDLAAERVAMWRGRFLPVGPIPILGHRDV